MVYTVTQHLVFGLFYLCDKTKLDIYFSGYVHRRLSQFWQVITVFVPLNEQLFNGIGMTSGLSLDTCGKSSCKELEGNKHTQNDANFHVTQAIVLNVEISIQHKMLFDWTFLAIKVT
ncbi:MAG: hypothetical protein ACI8SJ_002584 [Shewanella sp.]